MMRRLTSSPKPSEPGLPAISLPCGKDRKGLPIGLQLIGDCFQEKKLIRAAYTYDGKAPGIPVQTGQVWVLGAAPNAVEQPQKILVFVGADIAVWNASAWREKRKAGKRTEYRGNRQNRRDSITSYFANASSNAFLIRAFTRSAFR